jgi:hypothetical protein
MAQLATQQRADMLAQALQQMEVWAEQYKAFLGDVKYLEIRNRNLAVEERDPYLSGHKTGVATAYRHIFDELLAMYFDFLNLKEKISAGVTVQPRNDR